MPPRIFLSWIVISACLVIGDVATATAIDLPEDSSSLLTPPPAEEPSWLLPVPEPAPPLRALEVARGQVGTRYRYGGTDPEGFDCSGLVRYAYGQAGVAMPRTSRQMYRQVHPVEADALQPGDLVFFAISKRITTHVGIYAGDDLFLHAPSRGKDVSYASLTDPYWRKRLVRAGRWPGLLVAGEIAAENAQ